MDRGSHEAAYTIYIDRQVVQFTGFLVVSGDTAFCGTVAAILGGPGPAGEETIVYGDLDLGRIAEEQQSLDVVGHYNRPDIFDLRVDASPRAPVTWKRSPAQTYPEVALGALADA